MMRTRARFFALALTALATGASCGEPYAVRNPYDPDFPVTFTITGPDSVHSLGDIVQYAAQTTPPFPDTAFRWAVDTTTTFRQGVGSVIVDGATLFAAGAPGQFTVIDAPLEPATATVLVAALIGSVDTTEEREVDSLHVTIRTVVPRHVGYKAVAVSQRLVRIQLRCPDTHACATVAAGDTLSVWVDGFDARGFQISGLRTLTLNPLTGPPLAAYVIRDTTIATLAPVGIRAATVTGVRAGTTWIVGSRGALSDSLQIVVH
ncbi:MAG TPA: hypothetical protein VN613_04530 [Gemmatimonadaceae bacterium]|nr:hypothetical protein [Gemmatimonadaceae bacterium]